MVGLRLDLARRGFRDVAAHFARGERVGDVYDAQAPGELGLMQISEIMVLINKECAVKLAAPLPHEIQNVTSYDTASTAASNARDAARVLARNFTSDTAKKNVAATGIS